MKVDVETKQNYNVSNVNRGDTWIIGDDIFIIAWVDGVTLNYASPGVNTDDSDSYNVLIGLKDGLPWGDPDIMSNIAKSLREEGALKIDTKVVIA